MLRAMSASSSSTAFADDADRHRLAAVARLERALDRRIERRRLFIEIALVEPPLDARRIDFRDERGRLVHRRRERLRAAHPAQPRRHDELAAQRVVEALLRRPRRSTRTCPAGCPACRCRSTSRRSSGRTSSGRARRGGGTRPRWPSAGRGSSSRSARAARSRACGRRRPACPTAPAASRRSSGACSVATIASKHSQLRAALPMPP